LGIISNLKYRFKNLSAEEISKELDDPILRALVGGETITREKAMSIPSVSSNVDLISSMIASMPIRLYKDKGKKVEEIKKDYRISLLNDDTKDLLDAFQWKKALVTDYLMGKGGYSYVKWTRNTITGLYYVILFRMNFLSNILREEGGFDYKKAIVDSIVILIRDIPDAKESGLLHLCEFIEDCEFTYLSTQVVILVVLCCLLCVLLEFYLLLIVYPCTLDTPLPWN
jgi:hypothetical protein